MSLLKPFKLTGLKKILLSAIAAVMALSSSAQHFRNASNWKQSTNELIIGIGGANYMGDLGGGNNIGRGFLYDLDVVKTTPSLTLSYRKYVHKNIAFKGNFSYAKVAGDDRETTHTWRWNRNLYFRSDIIEFSAQAEFYLMRESVGYRYRIKGAKGSGIGNKIALYALVGAGGFYYNPQAQVNRTGKWHNLRKMGTEGQGIEAGTKFYSPVAGCIFYGGGVKLAVSRKINIGLEYAYRYTTTDFLDDVSGNYYDNDAIADKYGPTAAALADPNLGTVPDFVDGYYTYSFSKPGNPRGNPDSKDGYMFGQLTVTYKMFKSNVYGRKSKSRRSRPSF